MLDFFVLAMSRILTPLFAIGMVGAAFVVAVTFSRDLLYFLEEDEVRQTAGNGQQED